MNASTADAAGYAVMVGLGESYLVAFALAAGLTQHAAGLLNPVPQAVGAVIGLALPAVLMKVGSVKAVTVTLVMVQGMALVTLGVVAAAAAHHGGGVSGIPIFALATLYWTAGLAAGPVWNVWASSIFPKAIRPRFFGTRIRYHNALVISALVVAGLALGRGSGEASAPLWVYATLFASAGVARVISAAFLLVQSEPRRVPVGHRDASFREFFAGFRYDEGGRLLVYMLCFGSAAATAVPFFTPYLLGHLGLTYPAFMTLIATSFLVKAAVLPSLGAFAKRRSPHTLLVIGAVGTAPLAALWLVSESFWWLLAVHAVSGVLWACYELSNFLLLFDSIPEDRRIGLLVRFNLFNCGATAGGAAVGALVLSAMNAGPGGYAALFVLSTVLRIATIPLAMRIRERDRNMRTGSPA
jgi:hypothetical protein